MHLKDGLALRNNMLRIKYPQFLNCFEYLPPGSDVSIVEVIELLAYGTQDSKHLLCVLEKTDDYKRFIDIIVEKYNLPVTLQNEKYVSQYHEDIKDTKKKKAVKDIMVENYLIKIKRERGLSVTQIKKILHWINLRLFLKVLPLKNILIEDGEIIAIMDPIIESTLIIG